MASSSKRKIPSLEKRVDILKGLNTGQSCLAVVVLVVESTRSQEYGWRGTPSRKSGWTMLSEIF